MNDPLDDMIALMKKEEDLKDFISPPRDKVSENEKVIGTLTEKEIIILSVLYKTEQKLFSLKLKMVGTDFPYDKNLIDYYQSIITGLEKLLLANLLYRFNKDGNNSKSYRIKENWQVAIDAN